MTEDQNHDAQPAAEVAALDPVMHRPTDGVAPPAPDSSPDAGAAPQAAAPDLDRAGQPFDPARHQAGPDGRGVKTARGTWKLHGTRGRPFGAGNQAAAKDARPPAGAAPAETQPPSDSYIGAAPAGVRDAEAAPEPAEPAIDRAGYKTTAVAAVRVSFGLARLALGRAWEPSPQEAKEWTEAWQDALAEWQAPRLGATLALAVLAVTSASQRAEDPQTRKAAGGIVDWLAGLFGRRRPAASQPPPMGGAAPSSPGPALPVARSGNGSPVYDFATGTMR